MRRCSRTRSRTSRGRCSRAAPWPGISGAVGAVGTHDEDFGARITTVGYLPTQLPEDGSAQRDERYAEIRTSGGDGFGPAEPLQMWVDLVASGIRPEDVKVLAVRRRRPHGIRTRVGTRAGRARRRDRGQRRRRRRGAHGHRLDRAGSRPTRRVARRSGDGSRVRRQRSGRARPRRAASASREWFTRPTSSASPRGNGSTIHQPATSTSFPKRCVHPTCARPITSSPSSARSDVASFRTSARHPRCSATT